MTPQTEVGEVEELEILVLVDNHPGRPGLEPAWGFSALVRAGNLTILFDSGPDPSVLENNVKALNVDLNEVDFAVLSHEHGDHANGFSYVAEVRKGLTVYVPGGARRGVVRWLEGLGFKVKEVPGPTKLAPGVLLTGPVRPSFISEQALVVVVKDMGCAAIVGCSHPGIEHIIPFVYNMTGKRVFLVIGGFHLLGASKDRLYRIARTLERYGVEYLFPIHCTGEEAERFFAQELKDAYKDGHVGTRIVVRAGEVEVKG